MCSWPRGLTRLLRAAPWDETLSSAGRLGRGSAAWGISHRLHQRISCFPSAQRAHSSPASSLFFPAPQQARDFGQDRPGWGWPEAKPLPCHNRARPRNRPHRRSGSEWPAPSGEGASRTLTENRDRRPSGTGRPGRSRRRRHRLRAAKLRPAPAGAPRTADGSPAPAAPRPAPALQPMGGERRGRRAAKAGVRPARARWERRRSIGACHPQRDTPLAPRSAAALGMLPQLGRQPQPGAEPQARWTRFK